MEPPVPRGVKFSPSEVELVEDFLRPYVTGANFEDNLVVPFDLYADLPENIPHPVQKYFPWREYWYYVTRLRLRNSRPYREIRRQPLARWRYNSTKKIFRGSVVIGHKETLQLENPQGFNTGWKQEEFRLESQNFQYVVLVHLYYDGNADQRAQNAAGEPQGDQIAAAGPQMDEIAAAEQPQRAPIAAAEQPQRAPIAAAEQPQRAPIAAAGPERIAPNVVEQNALPPREGHGVDQRGWLARCFCLWT